MRHFQSGNPEVIVKVSDYDKNVLTVEKEDLKDAEGMVDGIKKEADLRKYRL